MSPTELPDGTLTTGSWQHVVFTFANGTGKFYKNGVLLCTKTGMASPTAWGGFQVGMANSNTIHGLIDDVRVYNTCLSDADVAALCGSTDTLFGMDIPVGYTWNGPNELGVRFKADVDGQITALRVFRPVGGPTSYTARLWTATGTPLASVTFAATTDNAWAEGTLATPVTITANTTYVASYSCPAGSYFQFNHEGLAN